MALTDYEVAPAARRTMNMFFLVDVSGSMGGEKISAVNDAMRNVLPIVREIGENNADAEIKLSTMVFSNSPKWVDPEPVSANVYQWNDQTALGATALGAACEELNQKLSHRHGVLKSASGSYAPVIILLSDGGPTDNFDAGLAKLSENAWFRHATRIAIAIGNDADVNVLKKFTDNIELVFRVHNIEALKETIKVAVVTSSQINSHSSSVGTGAGLSKADQTAEQMQQELAEAQGVDAATAAAAASINPDEFD